MENRDIIKEIIKKSILISISSKTILSVCKQWKIIMQEIINEHNCKLKKFIGENNISNYLIHSDELQLNIAKYGPSNDYSISLSTKFYITENDYLHIIIDSYNEEKSIHIIKIINSTWNDVCIVDKLSKMDVEELAMVCFKYVNPIIRNYIIRWVKSKKHDNLWQILKQIENKVDRGNYNIKTKIKRHNDNVYIIEVPQM